MICLKYSLIFLIQDYNQDVLVQNLVDLKEALNQLRDLKDLDSGHYFGPFLEVIRGGGTSWPVTSLALSSVHKFISYGLIGKFWFSPTQPMSLFFVDPKSKTTPATVDNIADAVTHTKFLSTDQNSDGVVLYKILQVLRTLVLSPLGSLLTHESMCEIMLSCFRISFEHRLSEHLRKSTEFCLKDMVQHLFTRLPEFAEDGSLSMRKIKMNKGSVDATNRSKKKKQSEEDPAQSEEIVSDNDSNPAEKTEAEDQVDDEGKSHESSQPPPAEYVNQQGVRFKVNLPGVEADGETPNRLVPRGQSWIHELFRFLVSLCNPLDKMNTDIMIHVGLTLIGVVLEVSADSLGKYPNLLVLIKDELCRNLFSVSLQI